MDAFDLMAETRYQQWLEKQEQAGYRAPAPVENTASRQSYESVLLSEIRTLLSKAAVATLRQQREEYVARAADLEVQLVISLERQGLPLVAQTLRGVIKRDRNLVTTLRPTRVVTGD